MAYHVEIGASNTTTFTKPTLAGVRRSLKRRGTSGARCSIIDTDKNREVYFGTVEKVIELIDLDLEMGHVE